ncbi:DUF4124 domain-containing protein [Aquisalimonas lutea]|uniref:DUF4124 domain-containing protein n=1 Tax=Aquisalimonas lutea TaxID=1327750 RepID=UPI0025B4032C|nr:DUF4124 domain-containing protein [Aquisalimonas lutea]MDN3516338.1 DUF4124 domain-containing protein [Aquisalimonas lutea]
MPLTVRCTRRGRKPARTASLVVLGAVVLWSPLGAEELYRWTDEDGNVHYSDTLPAERAPDARDIYDRAGRHLEKVDAALSEEERALERERRRQEREAEALRREEAREQAKYDRMLRRTYTSVEAVQEARDERLENLEATIELSRSRIARYREELERLESDAARQERMANGNPGPVYERIDQIEGRIQRQQEFIERHRADMEDIRETFGDHIERFRELQARDDG